MFGRKSEIPNYHWHIYQMLEERAYQENKENHALRHAIMDIIKYVPPTAVAECMKIYRDVYTNKNLYYK